MQQANNEREEYQTFIVAISAGVRRKEGPKKDDSRKLWSSSCIENTSSDI
jgi:hypothetical protein